MNNTEYLKLYGRDRNSVKSMLNYIYLSFQQKKNQVHSTFCWEMAAKTKLFIFFRSLRARRWPLAAWIFFEWVVTWLRRPITCHLSRRFALSHVTINACYFSVKVAWIVRKLIKLSAVFWKLFSAGIRSECMPTQLADFFYIKFLLQIPLKNDILLIFNGFFLIWIECCVGIQSLALCKRNILQKKLVNLG